MPLPPAAPRRHLHTRAVTYQGFLREDGLWDIEARMSDVKTYGFGRSDGRDMPAGTPIHGLSIRLTVDEEMVIRAVATAMDHTPFGECQQGSDPMQRMLGVRLGAGWRHAIESRLGGVQGCTHLRELLFNMATAAYQTIFGWREHERRQAGVAPTQSTEPPVHLGRCIAWDVDGPVTARLYPQFAGWEPLRRRAGPKAPPSSS